MPVTLSVDIGTSIIPLPFMDQAIAYSVVYAPDRKSATVDTRQYVVDDVRRSLTPNEVFNELIASQPGVWNQTYSTLDQEFSFEPLSDDKKFASVELAYDDRTYSWAVLKDEAQSFMMDLWAGRQPSIPQIMLASKFNSPSKTK